jgi:cellulose biosynthesis protein BcsQ
VLHNEHLKILLKHFGRLVWMPVPKYTSFREASAARRCIWSLAPDSKASGQAWKVVTRVAEKVEAWQSA